MKHETPDTSGRKSSAAPSAPGRGNKWPTACNRHPVVRFYRPASINAASKERDPRPHHLNGGGDGMAILEMSAELADRFAQRTGGRVFVKLIKRQRRGNPSRQQDAELMIKLRPLFQLFRSDDNFLWSATGVSPGVRAAVRRARADQTEGNNDGSLCPLQPLNVCPSFPGPS